MTQLPLLVDPGTGGIAALVGHGLPAASARRASRLVAATLIAWMYAAACPPATGQQLPPAARVHPVDGPGQEVNQHKELKPFCPSLVDGQGGKVRSRGTGGAAEASFAKDCPTAGAQARTVAQGKAKPAEPGLAVPGLGAGPVQDPGDGTPLVAHVTPERLSATVLTGGTAVWFLQSGIWTYLLILGLPLWRHVDLLAIVDSASSDDEHPATSASPDTDEERAVARVLQAPDPPRAEVGEQR
jgi:hypothetical protein